MCLTALAIGGSLIGGIASAGASRSAARSQERIGREQIDLQRDIYDDQTARFAPFLGAGQNALAAYNYEMGLGARPEGYGGYTATPGYEYRLGEGVRAIDASAASRGNLLSGATLRALQTHGQNVATQDYGDYMNRLGGMVGSGQSAAGMQASAGQNFATGATNALAGIGNAQAAGAIGAGNAISGTTNNILSTLIMRDLLAS